MVKIRDTIKDRGPHQSSQWEHYHLEIKIVKLGMVPYTCNHRGGLEEGEQVVQAQFLLDYKRSFLKTKQKQTQNPKRVMWSGLYASFAALL